MTNFFEWNEKIFQFDRFLEKDTEIEFNAIISKSSKLDRKKKFRFTNNPLLTL